MIFVRNDNKWFFKKYRIDVSNYGMMKVFSRFQGILISPSVQQSWTVLTSHLGGPICLVRQRTTEKTFPLTTSHRHEVNRVRSHQISSFLNSVSKFSVRFSRRIIQFPNGFYHIDGLRFPHDASDFLATIVSPCNRTQKKANKTTLMGPKKIVLRATKFEPLYPKISNMKLIADYIILGRIKKSIF